MASLNETSRTERRYLVQTYDRSPVVLRASRGEPIDPFANAPNHGGTGQQLSPAHATKTEREPERVARPHHSPDPGVGYIAVAAFAKAIV